MNKKVSEMTSEEYLDYLEERRIFKRDFAERFGQRCNINEDLEDDEADRENILYRRK